MGIRGQAVLGIWMDIVPEGEAEFNRWYREQHFPERLGVPGFLRGRRYLAVQGMPRYLTLYETEGPQVLSSEAYLARLNNPTDWTRRVLPTMRNVVRNAYRVVSTAGEREGEALVTLRLDPVPGRESELRTRYQREVLDEMARVPGVLSAALLEAEPVATSVVTEERKLVGAMAAAPRFLCVCELHDPNGVNDPAWRALLSGEGLGLRADVVGRVTENSYRRLYSLAWS